MAFSLNVSRITRRNANRSALTSLLGSRLLRHRDGKNSVEMPSAFVSGLTIMCSALFETGGSQSYSCSGENTQDSHFCIYISV